MKRATSREDLSRLRVGKVLPDAIYLHRDATPLLPEEIRSLINQASSQTGGEPFDIVRVARDGSRLALLAYPGFWSDAFPVLAQSWSFTRGESQVQHRDFRTHQNPPILHRKELLLPPDHPRRDDFARLTAQAEAAGLFEDTATIGHLLQWRETLRSRGLRVNGHRIERGDVVEDDSPEQVHRHRTALRRNGLSSPIQALYRHGYLHGQHTVFDYGCGRGDDLEALDALAVPASGWDPHFRPNGTKAEADVVNLGFVLNVIENLVERRDALLGAYGLAKKLLSVSVLIGGRTAFERYRLFRDGVLTARGTFQKYFAQDELRDYLEKCLGRQPVAVAPGIFFVFRKDEDEQAFLAARQSSRFVSLPGFVRPERPPTPPSELRVRTPRPRKPSKWEIHRPALDRFYEACLALGRTPEADEWEAPEELQAVGRPETVLRKLLEERGSEKFLQSRRTRIDDRSVYLALNLFEKRRSFGALPPALQRDVKEFWGSYSAAMEAAKGLLFSLGLPENLVFAARLAANEKLGFLATDDAFFFHPTVLNRLPKELRVFVGCATRLYGEVDGADIVKIHSRTAKLTTLLYEGFDESPLPMLLERTKIDLRRQELIFVDHASQGQQQVLYFKSRYLPEDFGRLAEQRKFDETLTLRGANFLDFKGFGPTRPELEDKLRLNGWKIEGFRLVRRRRSG